MGQYFTYITGVATLLAFIIQVRDVFPEHREARKAVLFLATGVFLGSILGSFNSVDIKLETEFHPVGLLLLVFLAIIVLGLVVLTVVAVTSADYQKRNELYNFIGGGVILFFFVLVATGMSFGVSGGSKPNDKLSNRELVSLTSYHLQQEDYEAALKYLGVLQFRYPSDDPRRQEIEAQIEKIKGQMAKSIVQEIRK